MLFNPHKNTLPENSGKGGIRTHGIFKNTLAFKTNALNLSTTYPVLQFYNDFFRK